jgi:putative FmdB family regulatory protein
MPTYEYRCPACGTDFEKFQKMSDPPLADCPACGAAAERRMSAGAGLVFKGSGFYITDYRGEGYRKAEKADSGAAPAASGGDAPAAKPESKPAAKKPAEAKPAAPKSPPKAD